MSIIHEALKKAWKEKESVPASAYQESVRKKLELEFHKKQSHVSSGLLLVLLLVFLAAASIAAPMFSAPLKKGRVPQPSLPTTRQSQFGIEELPLSPSGPAPTTPKMPSFNLTGIVYSLTDSYCILNGKVIKIGEEVQGARLTKITANGITLEYQGKEIRLSTFQ